MFVDLAESRKEIDNIDAEIVKLFEQRMKVAANVADYKLATGKPVFDKQREDDKIKNLKGMANGEFNSKCIAELFTQIMAMKQKIFYVPDDIYFRTATTMKKMAKFYEGPYRTD